MHYDTKCHDLASAYMSDFHLTPEQHKDLADKLAKDIQRAIEDFILDMPPSA